MSPEACLPNTCNFIKKTPAQVFPSEFCEVFKSSFFKQHLRATACKSLFLWPVQQTRFSARSVKLSKFPQFLFFNIYNRKERPLEWLLSLYFLHFLFINQKKIHLYLLVSFLSFLLTYLHIFLLIYQCLKWGDVVKHWLYIFDISSKLNLDSCSNFVKLLTSIYVQTYPCSDPVTALISYYYRTFIVLITHIF